MKDNLKFRKATLDDLPAIIQLLCDDALGATREIVSHPINSNYLSAFDEIQKDHNQFLMVIEREEEIIGTCHLTKMPSLIYMGSARLNVEGVRVKNTMRSLGIGEWMFEQITQHAKQHNTPIVQLTTNKLRTKAKKFYERIGFQATHEGMKMHL